MLNSNFQFSTFNFQLNTLFPFQKVLQAEAFPLSFLYIPVHHSFLYFACFVLPFEVVSVINQCCLYKLKLSINSPAVGNHRISVLHPVYQCLNTFCHPYSSGLCIPFLLYDLSCPSPFYILHNRFQFSFFHFILFYEFIFFR